MMARMQRNWMTHTLLWDCKMVQPWKTVCQFLKKRNTQPSNDARIASLGIYPRAMKTYVYTKSCT